MKHRGKACGERHARDNHPATVVGHAAGAVDGPADQRIGERVNQSRPKQDEPDQCERQPCLASVKRRQQHEQRQFEQCEWRAQKPVGEKRTHRKLGREPAAGETGAVRRQRSAGHGGLSARAR